MAALWWWFRRCSSGEIWRGRKLKASSNAPEVTVWLISLSHFLLLYLFVPFSAGAMLPEGGAGALRRHEAIRQGGGTHGTRQIHREPCLLVCGQRGQQLLYHHDPLHLVDMLKKSVEFLFAFILFNTSSLYILPFLGKTLHCLLHQDRKRLYCIRVCVAVMASSLPCSGVWAEEGDPQAAGVQKSRDQVFLQWVHSDLFPLFPSAHLCQAFPWKWRFFSQLSCDRGFVFSLAPGCLIYIQQQNVKHPQCSASLMYGSQERFNFTFQRYRPPLISCPSSRPLPGVVFDPHLRCPCLSLLSGARVYERVKRMREDERRKRTMLCDVLQYIHDGRACQQWLSKQAAMWVRNRGAVEVPLPGDADPVSSHSRRNRQRWRPLRL